MGHAGSSFNCVVMRMSSHATVSANDGARNSRGHPLASCWTEQVAGQRTGRSQPCSRLCCTHKRRRRRRLQPAMRKGRAATDDLCWGPRIDERGAVGRCKDPMQSYPEWASSNPCLLQAVAKLPLSRRPKSGAVQPCMTPDAPSLFACPNGSSVRRMPPPMRPVYTEV